MSMPRQNGLRAAHFGDTVFLVQEEIAKNYQCGNFLVILAMFLAILAIYFRY